MKKITLYSFLIALFFAPSDLFAQEEHKDTLALAENIFEDSFYESLKQKGMENFDKAIESLEKCKAIQSENAVIYFELGKNYLFQKKYKEAYDNFEKATKIDSKNRWAWAGLYDVCYDTKDYNQAINIVQKLVEFKADYREDLVSLYMNTQQFDKALDLINELNETVGKSDKRELYKSQILQDAKYQGSEKSNLIDKIKHFPKEESNYIALIYLYSQSNQEDKAQEIAKQLEKEIPTSDWAQVSLFKFHLNNSEGEQAVKSMNIVLASDKIDTKLKHRILNEFLIFTKNNPQFDKDLDHAIGYFENNKDVQVAKEIGKFYQNKKDWTRAIHYYEIQLKSKNDDMETIALLMQAYTENLQFDKLSLASDELLQLFPTQPQLYFYNGLANNQLKLFNKAKEILEAGLDFIIDNTDLEINFNLQLGEAYNSLGDFIKKDAYFLKANALIEKQKNKK